MRGAVEGRARRGLRRHIGWLMAAALGLSLVTVAPAAGGDEVARGGGVREEISVISTGADPRSRALTDTSVDERWLNLTDRLVIRRARGVGLAQAGERAADVGRLDVDPGPRAAGGFEVLELGEEITLQEAERISGHLVREGLAVSAEPDRRLTIATPPVNDPLYESQWHLHGRPSLWGGSGEWGPTYSVDGESAWEMTTGSNEVVVAVLDTGVTPHVDLVDRLVDGYDFVDLGPGGWDPGDWSVAGQCGSTSTGRNSSWHGLHVAGTIGATTDNGIGLAGIDQEAKILPIRVLGPCGGTESQVVAGIYWAAGASPQDLPPGVPVNPNPAKVINLSLGSSTPSGCGLAYQDAIDFAVSEGAIVVVAAGNSAADAALYSPANCENVITVAATSPIGDRAGYSNHGTAVDVAAPGGEAALGNPHAAVRSLGDTGTTTPVADTVTYKQGTSMATPHVSGIVSLMLSVDPDLEHDDVLTILRHTAQPFPQITPAASEWLCSDDPSAQYHCGAGIVHAGNAVAVAAGLEPPPPASTIAAAAGVRQATLHWKAVNPVAGLDRYELFRSTSASCSDSGTPIPVTTETSIVDSGLAAATQYRYCIRAVDQQGRTSSMSNTVTVTTAPATPSNLKASAAQQQVTVSWSSVSAAAKYELFWSTGSTACTPSSSKFDVTGTSFTHGGLTAGTKHNYCLTAVNSAGLASQVSDTVSATPTAPPAPPPPAPKAPTWPAEAVLRFDVTANGVKLSWPKASGTVTAYEVYRDNTKVASTTNRTVNVAGLKVGQRYRLRVRAVNDGVASSWLTLYITPAGGFRDVGTTSRFSHDIRWLATGEITRGCNPPTNDRFCPTGVVTREQMAAFIVRALGLTETSSHGDFVDVPGSNAFRQDINKLATAGITRGCNPPANTRFCPKDPVTRAQMAAFLTRALGLKATSAGGTFSDVGTGHTFRADVNRLATAGITRGCNPPANTRFCPNDHVTREQMAAFMRRGLAG